MRNYALERIANATGDTPRRVGSGNAQTYRVGDGPTIYLRTNTANQLAGDHRVYWFGLYLSCWGDPEAWFVLQCGLNFAVVVQVADWLPYRDKIGEASGGKQRQPHVHYENRRVELREATGLVLDLSPWVDNWDGLGNTH